MSDNFENITIIGGGLIGASWAALFLAHGRKVTVQDPADGAEGRIRDFVTNAWPALCDLGCTLPAPPMGRLTFTAEISTACDGADFVQECGPDRIEVKKTIITQIEAALAPTAVIASSTTALLASDIQKDAQHPDRILVGHPFNPPHLIPLVEVVPGELTSQNAVETAIAFYQGLDREIITVRKEVIGHVANRLSAALFREAVHLVADGIATVEDVDRAVSFGPGLRWALMGPHLTYHLGGGEGGYRGYLEHLGPSQMARWADLGEPQLDDETKQKLAAGVADELAEFGETDLRAARDKALVALLKTKKATGLAG